MFTRALTKWTKLSFNTCPPAPGNRNNYLCSKPSFRSGVHSVTLLTAKSFETGFY